MSDTAIEALRYSEFPNNSDTISRQAAIEAMSESLKRVFPEHRQIAEKCLNVLPSAQEKPFNLPEIYIAEGYDTIEGEDGNVGFGVYVPDETKIYVAGDVEGEIRARALFHEVCHWVQAMCGRPFDEDEANEFSDIVYDALPSAQPEQRWIPCSERLPETHKAGNSVSGIFMKSKPVLVYGVPEYESEYSFNVVTYCDDLNGNTYWSTEMDAVTINEVTAWMPLPEPYREGEQDENR